MGIPVIGLLIGGEKQKKKSAGGRDTVNQGDKIEREKKKKKWGVGFFRRGGEVRGRAVCRSRRSKVTGGGWTGKGPPKPKKKNLKRGGGENAKE